MPAICPYPEPEQSSPCRSIPLVNFNIIPHVLLDILSGRFPSCVPTKPCTVCFMGIVIITITVIIIIITVIIIIIIIMPVYKPCNIVDL